MRRADLYADVCAEPYYKWPVNTVDLTVTSLPPQPISLWTLKLFVVDFFIYLESWFIIKSQQFIMDQAKLAKLQAAAAANRIGAFFLCFELESVITDMSKI